MVAIKVAFTKEQKRLIELMRQKVEKKMKSYKEDFYQYDLSFIATAVEHGIRDFVWFLSDNGTHFIEEYQQSDQQAYLREIEVDKASYLSSGRANLFICNLENGEMRMVDSFKELYRS